MLPLVLCDVTEGAWGKKTGAQGVLALCSEVIKGELLQWKLGELSLFHWGKGRGWGSGGQSR